MKKKQIQQKVDSLGKSQAWNHNFNLPYGIQTRPQEQSSHGKNLVKLKRLLPLFDLIGVQNKQVLDVGCNEGFFSINMARRGASVLGIDADNKRIAKARFIQKVLRMEKNVHFKKLVPKKNVF